MRTTRLLTVSRSIPCIRCDYPPQIWGWVPPRTDTHLWETWPSRNFVANGENRHSCRAMRSITCSLTRLRSSLLEVRGSTWLGRNANRQEVSRCRTRGESEECIVCRWQSMPRRYPFWLWNPEDVTRSPKQGYQWLHKMDCCPPKNYKYKKAFP